MTMYYPMRVVRSGKYKLIWNIASSPALPVRIGPVGIGHLAG